MENSIVELKKAIFEYYFKLVFSHETMEVYELRHDLNSSAFHIFSFLCEKDLKEMCATQAEIFGFCQKLPEELNENPISALLEMDLDYYVIDLASGKEGMSAVIHTIDVSSVKNKKQRIIINI